jgi:uncharacterized protein YecT (DUF1311 family)
MQRDFVRSREVAMLVARQVRALVVLIAPLIAPTAFAGGSQPFRSEATKAAGAVSAGDCERALTTSEMERRTAAELEAARTEMETAYRKYLAEMPEPSRPLLEQAQRAWLGYRDANCKAAGSLFEGGSMQALAIVAYRLRMTKDRAAELQRIHAEPPDR